MGTWYKNGVIRLASAYGLLALISGCSALSLDDVVAPVKRALEPIGRSFDTRTYVVQAGDNLAYIAWRYQTTVDNLLAWNGLQDATSVYAGKAIWVRPPRDNLVLAGAPQRQAEPSAGAAPQPQASSSDTVIGVAAASESMSSQLIVPVQPRSPQLTSSALIVEQQEQVMQPPAQIVQVEPVLEPTAVAVESQPVATPQPTPTGGDLIQVQTASRDGLHWAWPQRGKIVKPFSPSDLVGQQGIDIAAGSAEPIRAASDGIVAFAGNEVSVLGRTIIIDHAEEFLSAYARVGKLLVEEGDSVRVGDVIAESDSGAEDGRFHFQIRRKGVPLNPLQFLPKGT